MRWTCLGCLLHLTLALVLGICIVWILWPAGASARWKVPNRQGFTSTPDGMLALLGDTAIQFFQTRDFTLVRSLPISAGDIVFSPNQSMIAARPPNSTGPETVRIYSASDGTLLHQLGEITDKRVLWMVWSPNSHTLAIRSFDPGTYSYWDTTTGLQIDPPFPQPPAVLGMAYSTDGQTVFLSTPESLIAVSTVDGRELYHQPLPSSRLMVTPDGTLILAYEAGNIRAFRASDGTLAWELGTDDSDRDRSLRFAKVSAVAISPNNQYGVVGETTTTGILGGVENGEIALIRIADGTIVRRYQGQTRGIISIEFTPDSKTFLSSNGDEIARWDVALLPPWLIWLPIAGIGLLLIHGVWQVVRGWRRG